MEKTRIMRTVARAFFDAKNFVTKEAILNFIDTNKLIPMQVVKQMSASEGKHYQEKIRQKIEEGNRHPVDEKNIQILKSTAFGQAEAAARAYAPVGFHK